MTAQGRSRSLDGRTPQTAITHGYKDPAGPRHLLALNAGCAANFAFLGTDALL
jgi:hypothetical protein